MLLLKANSELKKVFTRLIGTIKAPVTWTDIFAIANNNLILVGEVRSLIFNFDNKKVYTNILEIPVEDKKIDRIPNETLINNMMNMTLYAFGKWNSIGGLKVEKDYAELNMLFQSIFRPLAVEPSFRTENLRFFKNGLQITYEEVLQGAMELLKREGKVESEEEKEAVPEGEEDGTDTGDTKEQTSEEEYELGLWHNICWKIATANFEKSPQSEEDAIKARIGHDFYITDYQCPDCGEKLYIANYPMDKELLIETEEARVFMARTYACNSCNEFFTPRPGRLLQEGDVYCLQFGEDRNAFEDYLGLLGEKAEKTVNSKFNEYEFERNKEKVPKKQEEAVPEEAVQGEAVPEEAVPEEARREETAGKENVPQENATGARVMPKGTAEDSVPKTKKHDARISEETLSTTTEKVAPKSVTAAAETRKPESVSKPHAAKEEAAGNALEVMKTKLAAKTTDELKSILKNMTEQEQASMEPVVKKVLEEKLTAKYEARMGALDKLSPRQLVDLKRQLREETVLPEEERAHYAEQIESRLYHAEETVMEQKIELGKNKTYEEIGRIIEEVEKRDCPEPLRQETIKRLKKIREDRAEREVEHLILHMPLHLDRKQLSVYLDKLDRYKEVDITPYRKRIEERKDMAEKEEIAAFVKRGGKKDRTALWTLYNQLQEQDYKKENKEPFLEKIYDKIKKMDEEEIERICPSITSLSFKEGQAAYEKISQGMFLPELKTNTLDMIERRLTKLKTDESVQLMRKLLHDMEEKMTDLSGFYFYDAREEQKRNVQQNEEPEDDKKLTAMRHAVNGYAAGRDAYEYPILVADTTKSASGKEGFVLTPDHIFYRSLLNTGVVGMMDIEKVEENRGIFGKGIYLQRFTGKKVKLPHPVKKEEASLFAEILDDFVCYLQEKPESRNVEYLAKEKHDVKCCYRCGFTYRGGNICPKCGSKMNN